MDPIARMVAAGAAGAAGVGEPGLYVDDLFSTFLYEGNGSNQVINNGIRLGNTITSLRAYSMYATQGTNYTSIVPSGATFQEAITNGGLSGSNDDFVYSGGSVLDIYVDLVDAAVATAVKFAPQGDVASNVVYNTPSSLTIYGSNDASSWTTLDTNTGISSGNFTAGSFTTFSFSNSTAYRYYRIAAPAGTSISEWELVATSETAGEGGLVWLKSRGSTYDHWLFDTERGATKGLRITNDSEYTLSDYFSSFDSNGFTVGSNGSTNYSGIDFASWTFRKAPGFFDVVTYTGSGSAQNISHNLGSVPGMIIIKSTSNSENWQVWHRSVSGNLELDSTGALNSSSIRVTAVSSTDFTLSTFNTSNANGQTYVAYVFAHDDQSFGTSGNESIIKCGSYTGNGSTTGPVIDLGFEPQFVFLRCTSRSGGHGGGWYLLDSMRGIPTGARDNTLQTQETNAEDGHSNNPGDAVNMDLTPTGFQLTTTASSSNESGANYIYMAIRRPHKPPTAATEVFNVNYLANGSTNLGFVADTNISKYPDGTQEWYWNSRLTGNKDLNSNNSGSEDTAQPTYWDLPTNTVNYGSYGGYHVNYVFRRAPGFFDVVTYTGTNTVRTVNHNLGVAPELMIIKNRNENYYWCIYHKDLGNGHQLRLPNDNGKYTTNDYNSTDPTSSVFTVGVTNSVNESNDGIIAYLFASLDGISKVGSYTGTGGNIDVNCGFAAGARFILIKRTDTNSTGDWYVWDTARGIVGGNDPYHLLNSTAVQVTNTDYIDPLNAGFTVTSNAPAELNTSGGEYMFLAIA